jgi:hypothetical protein
VARHDEQSAMSEERPTPTRMVKRFFVLRGIDQVLVLAYLFPLAMVGYALAYLAYEPSYWFWPSVFVLVFGWSTRWLYRVGWRVAASAPPEYGTVYRRSLVIVQVLCPLAALVLSLFIYRSLKEGPPAPGHYPSPFSFTRVESFDGT